MSARADETANRGANPGGEPRTSARPPFTPRPKRELCPDCLGRGWPIESQYTDEKGRTVSKLAKDQCRTCGGCGHVGPKKYVRTGAARTLSAESLGKLGGMDVTRWPVSRRREP